MRFAILAAVAALGMSAPANAAVTVLYDTNDPVVTFIGSTICTGPSNCTYSDSFTLDLGLALAGSEPYAFPTMLLNPTSLFTSFKINGNELLPADFGAYFGVNGGAVDIDGTPLLQVNLVEFSAVVVPGPNVSVPRGYILLSDVRGVPEPATWGMMIGGFGMVGGSMRYRRLRFASST